MPDTYALARRVLLDALEALRPHLNAVTLVGAQAVYLRVGEADIAVAPTTTDGDLAFDPDILMDSPALDGLMRSAGFERKRSEGGEPLVGIWTKPAEATPVSIDLLMPESVAPAAGRRSARLAGHEEGTVLKVPGIEAALVDADVMTLSAIEASDRRTLSIRVAGPAALLVGKIHKILDREEHVGRLKDKDALDLFRLLRGTDTRDLVDRLLTAVADPRSRSAALEAIRALPELFGTVGGMGVAMAVRATEGLMPSDEVVESAVALTRDLLDAYDAAQG